MPEIFFLLLILSVIVLWTIWNYKNFIKMYAVQVTLILWLFAFIYWKDFLTDYALLVSFIFAVVVRFFIIPWVFYRFIKTSSLPVVEREFKFWIFTNLILYFISLWIISFISLKVFWDYNYIFISALFMVVSWFLNFVNHKKLIWDILSLLELENWIFLLSLLVLDKIWFYIELGIIIDIIMSISILMISTMKIKNIYWSINIDKISNLKD